MGEGALKVTVGGELGMDVAGTLFDKTGALPRQMHFSFQQRVEVPHGNGNVTKRLSTDMKARAVTFNPSQQEQRECALQTSSTHCTWYFASSASIWIWIWTSYAQALSSLHEVLFLA
jgi:hypothetical protein